MIQKKRHPLLFAANILIFAAVIILHTSEIADFSIKGATPMLVLPLITAYSIFSDLKNCVAAGLVCGAFLDSVAKGAYCFNTLTLMLLGLLVYFMANNLFNKNISSAAVLSLLSAALYYILLWLCFYCFNADMHSRISFLLKYALTSAVYSAVFIFPFYYIYKHFNKLKEH